jgi:hypothetical protein
MKQDVTSARRSGMNRHCRVLAFAPASLRRAANRGSSRRAEPTVRPGRIGERGGLRAQTESFCSRILMAALMIRQPRADTRQRRQRGIFATNPCVLQTCEYPTEAGLTRVVGKLDTECMQPAASLLVGKEAVNEVLLVAVSMRSMEPCLSYILIALPFIRCLTWRPGNRPMSSYARAGRLPVRVSPFHYYPSSR